MCRTKVGELETERPTRVELETERPTQHKPKVWVVAKAEDVSQTVVVEFYTYRSEKDAIYDHKAMDAGRMCVSGWPSKREAGAFIDAASSVVENNHGAWTLKNRMRGVILPLTNDV